MGVAADLRRPRSGLQPALGVVLQAGDATADREWTDGRRTLSREFLETILLDRPYCSVTPDLGCTSGTRALPVVWTWETTCYSGHWRFSS